MNPSKHSNLEAELYIIGAIMIDPERIESFIEMGLAAGHFSSPIHGGIYDCIFRYVCDRGWEGLDESTISALVIDRISKGKLDSQALDVLQKAQYTVGVDYEYFANQILDLATKRAIDHFTRQLADRLNDATGDEVIEWASSRIFQLSSGNKTIGAFNDPISATRKAYAGMTVLPPEENPDSGKWLTNFYPWDALLQCNAGQLVILAARPSVGKTALALTVANAIAHRNKPVCFFSLEMEDEKLRQRILASNAKANLYNCTKGYSKPEERRMLKLASEHMETLPIDVCDKNPINEQTIRSAIRQWKTKNRDGQWAFVDYLQLMSSAERHGNRQEAVAHISRSLKTTAMEFGVCMVALSQLNRDVEKNNSKPSLSHLRESGQIEQDADAVVFLHRPKIEDKKDVQKIEMIVAKQRNGPLGSVNLNYHASHVRFSEGC